MRGLCVCVGVAGQGMFEGATNFNGDISEWDVTHVTDMAVSVSHASRVVPTAPESFRGFGTPFPYSQWLLRGGAGCERLLMRETVWDVACDECGGLSIAWSVRVCVWGGAGYV